MGYATVAMGSRDVAGSLSDSHAGICLMTTAGCTSYQGLYVQRFFLGALESGVSPAWMLVVGGKSNPLHEEAPT